MTCYICWTDGQTTVHTDGRTDGLTLNTCSVSAVIGGTLCQILEKSNNPRLNYNNLHFFVSLFTILKVVFFRLSRYVFYRILECENNIVAG